MGAFGGMIITNKGRALQAKAQTGIELKYTRIKVGDGKLGGQSIPTLNDLISAKKSLDIKKLEVRPGGKAVVGSMLSNAGLKSGFYFREIGVFAQDPDEGEILYSYGNSGENAEYIPPEGGPDVIEKYIDVVTIVQNAPNVSAVIDGSLVYPTNKEMEVAIKEYFEANNNAKIMPPKAFKAEDPGDEYPKGMSMFYLDADGMEGGWPVNNGQVITWVTARNRLSQLIFETNVATQRIWTRRWSSTQKAWSDFLEQETTAGSAEKVVQALKEAKAYTDEKTATIDAPVKSVNSKTGDVVLTSDDVGAVAKNGDSVIAGMLSMSKNDGPHLQLVGTTSAHCEWYVNNERKGWLGVGNRNEPSTIRLASEVGPLAMQSNTDAVYIHGPEGVFLEGRRVVAELDLVKQSVVDGKGVIAGAINGKGGGPVSANSTFPELAAGVNRINTGGVFKENRGQEFTQPNSNFQIIATTLPLFSQFVDFYSDNTTGYPGYEDSTVLYTKGVSSGTGKVYIRDANGHEHEISRYYVDDYSLSYRYNIVFLRIEKSTRAIRIAYRSGPGNAVMYEHSSKLPADFNLNAQLRISYDIVHGNIPYPGSSGLNGTQGSFRGTFVYV